MASRNLKYLYEPFQKIIEKALKIADEQNLPITITCTKRSQMEQEALYAQGREELIVVNAKRKKVKLGDITLKQNQRKVTWTLNTYHSTEPKSMAIDYAIGKSTTVTWDTKADLNNNKITDYKEFGEICKSVDPDNIQWGGDWKKKDWCHVQWKNGREIDQTIIEDVIPPKPVVTSPEPRKEKTEEKPPLSPPVETGGITTVAPTPYSRVVNNILRLFFSLFKPKK